MNWHNVKLILGREIRDQLRDRRTLFMIFVLPMLLYPILGMTMFQAGQFLPQQPSRVLVVGAQNLLSVKGLPPLFDVDGQRFHEDLFSETTHAELLELHRAERELGGDAPLARLKVSARHAVQRGDYDAAICFPQDFAQRLDRFRRAIRERKPTTEMDVQPEVLFSTAKERSQRAFELLREVIQRWIEAIGRENLEAAGVPVEAARPFGVDTADVAERTSLKGAALWSKILPILLLVWALTGAFYPAIDLCAGEKERGTLETLLCSPAERMEIVLGKLGTIMLFSMATSALNLLSMGITGTLVLSQIRNFGPPPVLAIVWLPLALVPMSALFSALCLALAAFARSTKEGQYYLMPLLLITMPLVLLPVATGMELNLGNSLIPITGVVLLLRAALEGDYWLALQFLPAVAGVTLGGCLLAIRWAVEQFNSESVLFRESERIDVVLWIRHLVADRRLTPSVGEAIFCGMTILLLRFFLGFAVAAPQSFADFARVQTATLLAVILAPAVLMAVMLTRSPRKTLLLVRPPLAAVPVAVALALFLHPVARALQAAVMHLYPPGSDVLRSLKGIEQLLAQAPLWQLLLVMAVAPAICEELAFRGFILSGFRHLGHKWRAIVYSALFFGLSHVILQQSIIAFLAGLVIAFVAVQSGSVYPTIAFHFVHNALTVAATHLTPEVLGRHPLLKSAVGDSASQGWLYQAPAVIVCGLLSLAILVWFQRLSYVRSEEESEQERLLIPAAR